MQRNFFIYASLLASLLAGPFFYATPTFAEGLTRAQGDAILKELREMRKVLERIEKKPSTQARNAPPKTAQVPSKGGSIVGDANAPVTLIEFTDYQCPYCTRFFKTTYPELKKKYIDTGKVRLVIKDLPLNFHPHARKAAQATRCAGEQERFLDMHEYLFSNVKKLDAKDLPKYAEAINLDMEDFNECLNSKRHLKTIDKDTEQARKQGISGTPTFVIGKTTKNVIKGARIVGARPIQDFSREIEILLKK